jgi:hypothetical protein
MTVGQGRRSLLRQLLFGTLPLAPAPARVSPAPSCAFDIEPTTVGGFVVRGGQECSSRPEVDAWIRAAGRAVTGYYGRFPAHRARVELRWSAGSGIGQATTRAAGGVPRLAIELGLGVTTRDLEEDWVLTHEMVHLALPDLPASHRWLEEGIATYVEPVARARAGLTAPDAVFGEWMRDMPKGLPQKGDRGLDRTPTWGRTYWGGALFCLLADVAIREHSSNRFGLEHALRAIHDEWGGLERDGEIERLLATGDRATGGNVLRDLYERLGLRPEAPDLPGLWRRLGLSRDGGGVQVDDHAPLAAVRRAIAASESRSERDLGSGEPTPVWWLPLIVVVLATAAGLLAGWDAGVRVTLGCGLVGLAQAMVLERIVAADEHETGRKYFRIAGSRILRGTRLGHIGR